MILNKRSFIRKFIKLIMLIFFIINCNFFKSFEGNEAKKVIFYFKNKIKNNELDSLNNIFVKNAKFTYRNFSVVYLTAINNYKNFKNGKNYIGDIYIDKKKSINDDYAIFSVIGWVKINDLSKELNFVVKLKKDKSIWKITELSSKDDLFKKIFLE